MAFPDPTPPLTTFCPRYHRAVEILGRRWTGAIVRALLAGCTRFGELREAVPGLSDRLLSARLKELEAEGIVERRVLPETPVRVEYHLTSMGGDLAGVVRAIADWAEEWMPADERRGRRKPRSGAGARSTGSAAGSAARRR